MGSAQSLRAQGQPPQPMKTGQSQMSLQTQRQLLQQTATATSRHWTAYNTLPRLQSDRAPMGAAHLQTLDQTVTDTGTVTPPHQMIPQSAFTDQDWEAEIESQPPQWGTPHPTHGYLDTVDRASPESSLRSSNMPQIDIDAPTSPSLCTVTPQQSQQSQQQLAAMRTVHAQQMTGMEQAYMHMALLQAP